MNNMALKRKIKTSIVLNTILYIVCYFAMWWVGLVLSFKMIVVWRMGLWVSLLTLLAIIAVLFAIVLRSQGRLFKLKYCLWKLNLYH